MYVKDTSFGMINIPSYAGQGRTNKSKIPLKTYKSNTRHAPRPTNTQTALQGKKKFLAPHLTNIDDLMHFIVTKSRSELVFNR